MFGSTQKWRSLCDDLSAKDWQRLEIDWIQIEHLLDILWLTIKNSFSSRSLCWGEVCLSRIRFGILTMTSTCSSAVIACCFRTGKTQDPFIDIRSLCLFSVWDCSFRFILWSAIIFAAFFFHVYLIRFRSETRLSLNWRSNMFSFFFVGMFSFLLSRMFLIPFHCYLHHQLRTEIPVCAPEHNCRLLEREQLNYAPGDRKNDNIMSLYATTINTTIFIYFNYLLHFTFSLLGIFHYNC